MAGSAWTDPRAGSLAQAGDLIDVAKLVDAYFADHPDPGEAEQRVLFGTSGHRGSSLNLAFNEDHILAISQAICEYRAAQGITGPLFVARDTHALSEPALTTALDVFAANDVVVVVDSRDGYTPTPALSHAIVRHNLFRPTALADGVVITPSHNPPGDGGFKYNPPNGGPAGSDATLVIENRANELLGAGLAGVRRSSRAPAPGGYDFLDAYVGDLPNAVDLAAVRAAGVRIGADPLGGASVDYWAEIGSRYNLDLTVVNPVVDPTWRFMTLDWDGKIRMDCSSAFAMTSLVARRSEYDIAVGNDADADRHGIVTPQAGLMNPNNYLATAIDYLFRHRQSWSPALTIGKTVVSSSMINRVAADLHRTVVEVPVGFKWFVPGLGDGTVGFAGEESAGGSFLRLDGSAWTTDKDGILLCLLAAELTAVTGRSPSEYYDGLTERFGRPSFARIDAPATLAQRTALGKLSPDQITATELAGEPIIEAITSAPGNGAAIGGIKVSTASGWFAARPSGTENVYKIYAESFQGDDHLCLIQEEAIAIVGVALGS